jgi:hypothetical protein
MLIQYIHPARGLTSITIAFDCHNCALHFDEPNANEVQQAVNAPVSVHCPRCSVLVRTWSPPAAAPASPTTQRIMQRRTANAEVVVSTGQADPGAGWVQILQLVSVPLEAGAYQLTCYFELSLTAVATWGASGPNRTAQARLLLNGSEVSTWVNPYDAYHRVGIATGDMVAAGATPTLSLELRRFGTAGSARIRRCRLELQPVGSPDIDDTV